jgi:hypothetical protein
MNPLTYFKKLPILPNLIVLAIAVVAAPTVAWADTVLDWNAHAATAIVGVAGQPPSARFHPSRHGSRGDL